MKRARERDRLIIAISHDPPGPVKLGVVDQARLLKAAGTRNPRFAKQILNQLINSALPADGENPVDGEYLNGLLETLAALKPRDELEAMLMAQMLATNSAAAAFLRKTNHAATFEQLEVNSGITSRLLRTYALQLEALQRYRSKGKQKVTVRHVHVHAGAQAIVGDVHPGGTSRKTKGLHHAQAAADAPLAALRGPIQADGGACKSPAMPNGRCRMHGGKSPGAPRGNQHALKHGYWSSAAVRARKAARSLIRSATLTLARL
jgi:hypothetical protein